jgi:hypothetical protein
MPSALWKWGESDPDPILLLHSRGTGKPPQLDGTFMRVRPDDLEIIRIWEIVIVVQGGCPSILGQLLLTIK